ncbi:hypothetical protein [Streptomyces rimosus]|uniref:hypothetical protein n=1 Tax=Streptomyces rimosus TaxID=1927 RepID=UPI00131AFCB0|nr:hypothetical protein [Streptomyces rimosus]
MVPLRAVGGGAQANRLSQVQVVWVVVALGREEVMGQPLNSACPGIQNRLSKAAWNSRSSAPGPFQYRCSPWWPATRAGEWLEWAPGTARGRLQLDLSLTAHHSAWSRSSRQAR